MLKKYSLKIPVLIFALIALYMVSTFAADEEQISEEPRQISEQDTTKVIEIRIGDEGIYIRKETGEEFRYKIGEIQGLKKKLRIKPPIPPLPREVSIRVPRGPAVFTTIIRHDVVKAGSDIVVEEEELVKGDITALGGDVTVEGKVTGSVVAIGGDIIVTSTGEIEKDATSIGGDVKREAGGIIRGEVVGVGFFPSDVLGISFGRPVYFGLPFIAGLIKILFLLFIGLVVFSVAPNQVTKVKTKLEKEMLKSGLVGFLGEILILPVFVLLIITVIGIPVAILVEPLVILLAILLGYIAVSLYIGERFKESTNVKPKTGLMTVLLGIILVELIPLFARLIGMAGEPGSALGMLFVIVYWTLIYLILTIGFGAVILTRFGTRPREVKVVAEQKTDNKSTSA